MRRAATVLFALLFLAACEEEQAAGGGKNATGKAQLALELVEMSYALKDGLHTYSHNRQFTESGGVGVDIKRGKVCVLNGERCVDALVAYRVDASATLLQKGHHVASPNAKDTITLHYWAEDDAGNKFELHKAFKTDGEKITAE